MLQRSRTRDVLLFIMLAGATACAGKDGDGDGFGNHVDCNDADPSIHPSAEEICDERDNNCDGQTDEGVTTTFWIDEDGDGAGDANTPLAACVLPQGFIDNDLDCDDSDPEFHPEATEDDCTDPNDYNCDGTVEYIDGRGRAPSNRGPPPGATER